MTRREILPSLMQVTLSVVTGIVAAWLFGFFIFFGVVAGQSPENTTTKTDLTVVLTGGTGRVETGLGIAADGLTKELLISGVHADTNLKDLVDLWAAPQARKNTILRHCCISIGRKANDTQSNATEALEFVQGKNINTIRLVTSNYHMPRAWLLFKRALPDKTLMLWPVAGNSPATLTFWRNLFVEYTKTLLTWMS